MWPQKCTENCQAVFSKIKENLNKWSKIPCLWFGRSTLTRYQFTPKLMYMFSVIPIKMAAGSL